MLNDASYSQFLIDCSYPWLNPAWQLLLMIGLSSTELFLALLHRGRQTSEARGAVGAAIPQEKLAMQQL